MKNYVQKGESLTVNAPTGGVASGAVVLVNKLLGIAAADATEGAAVEVQVEGVFSVPKASADDVGVGDTLYWSASNGNFTKTASGNSKAGYAVIAAGAGTTTVNLKLTPGVA